MQVHKSQDYAHVEWIELNSDGIMHECAVLKTDRSGNKLFLQLKHLDNIDRIRLATILMDRNAGTLELWDLMQQKTLKNGMNALSYFHQYVKVLTNNGKILDPKGGQAGATGGSVNLNTEQ